MQDTLEYLALRKSLPPYVSVVKPTSTTYGLRTVIDNDYSYIAILMQSQYLKNIQI